MATFWTDAEIDGTCLRSERIAILGYGSQGHAHALNLRDSGSDVRVAVRPGPSFDQAQRDGWQPMSVSEATNWATIVVFCLPDGATPAIYEQEIAPKLNKGQAFIFCHGYHVHFGSIALPADVDVLLVAPSGPGASLRQLYADGFGLPCLVAVQQDFTGSGLNRALAYASAIGCGRAKILESTFKEETETDLFGEQVVLVGGLMGLVQSGYDTLIRRGYQSEVAYFECLHQVKLLAELMQRGGIAGMLASISDTAHWGAHLAANRVIGEPSKEAMQEILDEICDGTFAKNWVQENRGGCQNLRHYWTEVANSNLQQTGQALRKSMPFLNPLDAKVEERRNLPPTR